MTTETAIQRNTLGQPIGLPVHNSANLSFANKVITGQYVELIPMQANALNEVYIAQLWQNISCEADSNSWTYLPYDRFLDEQQLKNSIKNNFNVLDTHHFFICLGGQALGWVALLNLRLIHAAVEIGNIYFASQLKQRTAATEALFLLLDMCFQSGFRRVEWKCDNLNAVSKRAAQRLGFTYEGVFRQDRIVKGRNRDTAWFSLLDHEWPLLKPAYTRWLHPDNFDLYQQQKQPLAVLLQQIKEKQ